MKKYLIDPITFKRKRVFDSFIHNLPFKYCSWFCTLNEVKDWVKNTRKRNFAIIRGIKHATVYSILHNN